SRSSDRNGSQLRSIVRPRAYHRSVMARAPPKRVRRFPREGRQLTRATTGGGVDGGEEATVKPFRRGGKREMTEHRGCAPLRTRLYARLAVARLTARSRSKIE